MIVDLSSIGDADSDFSFEAGPAEIDLGDEPARLKEPVRVTGSVSPGTRVEVKGRITGVLELDCTRCLKPVETPLDLVFDDVFVDASVLLASLPGELGKADLTTDALSDSQIDLNELAREQLLLSIPDRFFCKDDCKGLCDRCRANLNEGDCGCPKGEEDPRWSALKNLK